MPRGPVISGARPPAADPGALLAAAERLAETGRHGEAAEALEATLVAADRALARWPREAALHNIRGRVLHRLQRYAESVAAYRKALMLSPGAAPALYNLALVLAESGDRDGAVAAGRRAVAAEPAWAEAHYNLACDLQALGRYEDAAGAYRTVLALEPGHRGAHNNLAQCLLLAGRIEAAIGALEAAVKAAPADPGAHSNLLLGLHYDPRQDSASLLAAHRAWDAAHGAPRRARIKPHDNDPDPARRLRLGFVSPDFYRHPVGYFLVGFLEQRDRTAFEVTCYSNRRRDDDLTRRLEQASDRWQRVAGFSPETLADRIRADRIDILVDLAGHTAGNSLLAFAERPAPVQASWIGYIDTTGLEAIDYLITDPHEVPEGEDRFFVERLLRLPHGSMCYTAPEFAPEVAPAPALARGHPTFGCFNNLAKVNDGVIALWAELLRAVPTARLLLKSKALGEAPTAGRIRAAFAAHGIDAGRLTLDGFSPHPAMLQQYGEVDIALDPFPYSGGLTSCEALWMGVPVVTLGGDWLVSRQTVSFLRNIGLPELIAADAAAYVSIAAGLAADPDRLAALRAGMRQRMAASPLCDARRFARDVEAALRRMWRSWCEAR